MLYLAVMSAGVIVALRLLPVKYQRLAGRFQIICTAVLVFSMGVSLGSRPDFFASFCSLGYEALILALLPTALSVLAVWLSVRALFKKDKEFDGSARREDRP